MNAPSVKISGSLRSQPEVQKAPFIVQRNDPSKPLEIETNTNFYGQLAFVKCLFFTQNDFTTLSHKNSKRRAIKRRLFI